MQQDSRLWFVHLRRPLSDDALIAARLSRGERITASSSLEVLELLPDGRVIVQRQGEGIPRMSCAKLSPLQAERIAEMIKDGRVAVVRFDMEVIKRCADGSYLAITQSPHGFLLDTDPPLLPALDELLGFGNAA
jgi:hypothetical protein